MKVSKLLFEQIIREELAAVLSEIDHTDTGMGLDASVPETPEEKHARQRRHYLKDYDLEAADEFKLQEKDLDYIALFTGISRALLTDQQIENTLVMPVYRMWLAKKKGLTGTARKQFLKQMANRVNTPGFRGMIQRPAGSAASAYHSLGRAGGRGLGAFGWVNRLLMSSPFGAAYAIGTLIETIFEELGDFEDWESGIDKRPGWYLKYEANLTHAFRTLAGQAPRIEASLKDPEWSEHVYKFLIEQFVGGPGKAFSIIQLYDDEGTISVKGGPGEDWTSSLASEVKKFAWWMESLRINFCSYWSSPEGRRVKPDKRWAKKVRIACNLNKTHKKTPWYDPVSGRAKGAAAARLGRGEEKSPHPPGSPAQTRRGRHLE